MVKALVPAFRYRRSQTSTLIATNRVKCLRYHALAAFLSGVNSPERYQVIVHLKPARLSSCWHRSHYGIGIANFCNLVADKIDVIDLSFGGNFTSN